MKRMVLTSMAVVCLAGVMYAQDDVVSTVTVDPTQQAFSDLWTKWIEFNNWDKDAAYQTIDEIEQKVREEFPMDPEVQKQVNAISEKMYADLEALANEMGYSNFKDAYGSGDPRVQELKQIESVASQETHNLTESYYQELQRRYRVACIDALTRLMENAQSVK